MNRALGIERSAGTLLGAAEIAHAKGNTALANQLIEETLKIDPNNLQALLAKAESLRHHDDKTALGIADRIIVLDKKGVAGKIERILLLADMNQSAEAMKELNAILAKTPNMPIANYYKAVFLSNEHQVRAAWLIAENLPREFVQADAAVAISVASIASANGNLEAAGATLAELLTNHPENSMARLRLGAVRIEQGSYEVGAQILAPLIEDKDPQALALMAQASMKQGRYGDTLDYLERANAAGPGSDLLKKDLALAEVNFGKSQQGIDDLQKLEQKEPERVEFAGPLIGALIKANRFKDAQAVLDRFSAAAANSPFVGFYRAQIQLANGDTVGAIASYDASLKVDPKFMPSLFYRAKAEGVIGKRQDAIKDIDRVLAQDPTNALALVQKATYQAQSGDDTGAMNSLRLAIAKAPTNPLPRLALANLQMALKKYDDAGVTVAAWMQVLPNDADALTRQGEIQLAKGQKREAVGTFGALTDRFPKSGSAQLLLAQAQAASGDQASAIATAKRAQLLVPDSEPIREAVVVQEVKLGDADDAIQAAKDFQSSHPGTDSDLLVTDTYFQLRRLNDAKATLQQSLSRSPDQRVLIRLAQVEALLGDYSSAMTLVNGALQKKPTDLDLRRVHASLLLQSGNAQAARGEYEAVLREAPNDAQTLNDLAWIIQDTDINRAIALATRAVQSNPTSGEVIDTLGWLMYRHGDAKGALGALTRAHGDSSSNGEISYHLAVVLNATGKRAEAKALLEAALATDHSFGDTPTARKLVTQWQ
jgi:putative PEP-CTERM system TPR-repeat lipoprotein